MARRPDCGRLRRCATVSDQGSRDRVPRPRRAAPARQHNRRGRQSTGARGIRSVTSRTRQSRMIGSRIKRRRRWRRMRTERPVAVRDLGPQHDAWRSARASQGGVSWDRPGPYRACHKLVTMSSTGPVELYVQAVRPVSATAREQRQRQAPPRQESAYPPTQKESHEPSPRCGAHPRHRPHIR